MHCLPPTVANKTMNTGEKNPMLTPVKKSWKKEERIKMASAARGRYGIHCSEQLHILLGIQKMRWKNLLAHLTWTT